MNNFWFRLPKGFTALAPMADVTDAAFRQMFVECGQPDVMWTEFVSADGLFLAPEQDRKFWLPNKLREIAVDHGVASDNPLLKDLIFSSNEQPIVAQFFSRDPERMRQSARLAAALGFAGIDINMGCPARVIVNQGAGCAMIREPDQARQVIKATLDGANGQIPVSVKTRTGFSSDDECHDWIKSLLDTGISTLTVHARTRKDMSKVPARWDNITEIVGLRDRYNPEIKIVGNGDVRSLEMVEEKVSETGCDGVMIGRGIFGNPWVFNTTVSKENLIDQQVLETVLHHASLFDRYLGDTKSFSLMRKHFKSYLTTTALNKSERSAIININNFTDLQNIIAKMLVR